MKSYSNQEVLDIAVRGLRAQGAPGYDWKNDRCRYRTADGRKCAIGMLIPDEKYRDDMEHYSIDGVLNGVNIDVESSPFCAMLQGIHDSVARECSEEGFLEAFEKQVRDYARYMKLEYPE